MPSTNILGKLCMLVPKFNSGENMDVEIDNSY